MRQIQLHLVVVKPLLHNRSKFRLITWHVTLHQQPTGSNVPVGDPDKEQDRRTTFQTAYTPHDLQRPFDRQAAVNNNRKSNIVLDDGLGDWNQGRSTFVDSYKMSDQPGSCTR